MLRRIITQKLHFWRTKLGEKFDNFVRNGDGRKMIELSREVWYL
jgi:hypothetical protein